MVESEAVIMVEVVVRGLREKKKSHLYMCRA